MAVVLATLPFFALVLVGWLAGRLRVLDAPGVVGVNRYVFYFALPAFLFLQMSETPPSRIFELGFVVAYAVGALAMFALGAALARVLFRCPLAECSVFGLAGSYGNIGFLAIPLLTAVVGDALAVPLALMLTVDLVLLVPLGMLVIEAGRGRGHVAIRVLRAALRVILTNPLVIAIVLGLAVAAAGVQLPHPIRVFADLLGGTAGPCAMFALGATLAGRPLGRGLLTAATMSGVKLALHPLLMFWVMRLFGIGEPWSSAAVLGSAMPIAAVLFVVAQQYNTAQGRASAAVLLSTALAVLSLPLVLTLVR